jgi:hypothetical protein
MKLLELFDTDVAWKEVVHNPKLIEYLVTIGYGHFTITFEQVSQRAVEKHGLDPNTWLVEFSRATGPGGKDPYGITNTGNAPQVLAVVTKAMQDFAAKHRVQYMMFSAHEESRKSLYRRMISRLGTLVKVYNVPEGEKYIIKVGN